MAKAPSRKGNDTHRHTQIIDAYISEGWHTHGFKAAAQTLLVGHSCQRKCVCATQYSARDLEGYCEWRQAGRDLATRLRVVPDGYRIVDGRVEVLEVDVHHHTSDEKLKLYSHFWFSMDAWEDVELNILIVDRFGAERVFRAVDVYYYGSASPFHTRVGPAAPRRTAVEPLDAAPSDGDATPMPRLREQ